MSGIHVSLPSNVRGNKANVNGDYNTTLKRPLVLEGGKWEVGMTGIIYSNTWYNLRDGSFSVNYVDDATAAPPKVDMRVAPGRYANVREVVAAMMLILYRRQVSDEVQVVWNSVTNRTTVTVSPKRNTGHASMLVLSDELSEILGFKKRQAIISLPNAQGGPVTGTLPADVDRGMTSLFVYSDVVEVRRVGNVLAPLLRVVPLSRDADRHSVGHYEFDAIHYLPVSNVSSENINIRVCRDNGETVVFDGGKVLVNLHFRPVPST